VANFLQIINRLLIAQRQVQGKTPPTTFSNPQLSARTRYRALLLRTAITVAHEVVHVYNLFLQRGFQNHTPPTAVYGPYGNVDIGESGRFWEWRMFGGFVDMREDRHASKGPPQLDNHHEFIGIRDGFNKYCWQIRTATVDGLVDRQFGSLLRRGITLYDEDHPAGELTIRRPALHWARMGDVFEGSRPEGALTELPREYVDLLVSPRFAALPSFNLNGHDLRQMPFAIAKYPNAVPRFVESS
jgi:hypothetical protein